MKRLISILIALVSLVAVAQVGDLERSSASSQGVDPVAVTRFIDSLLSVPSTDIHHVMVVRHGKVIAEAHPEPYRAEDAHTLYSASKTFTAIAVGIAVGENRLRLTDRVATFFPDKLPAVVSDDLAEMTVRDLLIMASGIKADYSQIRRSTSDWIATWLGEGLTYKPGTYFHYDSMCSLVLAAIVQRVTGESMLDYLKQHVFGPMHITEADWEQSPEGVNTGGWGLRLQTESLAKAGILMLNRGEWQGEQLVPSEWIDEMVTPHINYATYKPGDAPTEGNQGYGYQVWRCKNPRAYRADGAFGQYVVCIPEADMVVVITGMSHKGHDELACIWKHLMPGVDNVSGTSDKAQAKLEQTCSRASLPTVRGKNGKKSQRLILGENRHNIGIIDMRHISDSLYHFVVQYRDMRYIRAKLGYGKWWRNGGEDYPPYSIDALERFKGLERDFKKAGSYAWTGKKEFTARIEFVNWISSQTYVVDLGKNTVTVTDSWAPSKPETIQIVETRETTDLRGPYNDEASEPAQ